MTQGIERLSDHAKTSVFIYYTIRPDQGPALMEALQALLRALPPEHNCALMRRSDVRPDGLETWMEVHGPFKADDAAGRRAMIEDLAQRCGVAALAGGRRIVECFEQIPGLNPCA